jgi:hypothetical protein
LFWSKLEEAVIARKQVIIIATDFIKGEINNKARELSR